MVEEPQVIREQMDMTRAALSDKLEALENRVVNTVEGATCAVSQGVDSVKEAVQHTVEVVQQSVSNTVGSVKEAFDIRAHTAKRPWLVLAGAATLGYLGGCWLNRSASSGRSRSFSQSSVAPAAAGNIAPEQLSASFPSGDDRLGQAPSWLNELEGAFHQEIQQLKGLALGAALGVARDLAARAAPPPLEKPLTDWIDNVTTKLGGTPMQGHLLSAEKPRAPGYQQTDAGTPAAI